MARGHGSGSVPPKSLSPPLTTPWDRVSLAAAGFSTAAEWLAEFGVQRDYRAVVWHDLEGYLPGALSEWAKGNASAHLVILRDGTIVLTVPIEHVSWHAGTNATIGRTAFWRTHNVNPHSIGVELEGFYNQPYTPQQAASVRRIALWAEAKYGIHRAHTFDQIEGHHAHSELSNQRKDPGAGFDWTWVTA